MIGIDHTCQFLIYLSFFHTNSLTQKMSSSKNNTNDNGDDDGDVQHVVENAQANKQATVDLEKVILFRNIIFFIHIII